MLCEHASAVAAHPQNEACQPFLRLEKPKAAEGKLATCRMQGGLNIWITIEHTDMHSPSSGQTATLDEKESLMPQHIPTFLYASGTSHTSLHSSLL